MISLEFVLTSLLIVLMPGTGVIYTVSTGITGSRKDSIVAAVGCTAGIIPHIAASIIGLSAIFHTSALVFQVVKMIGVVYLLYLGIGMIRNKGGLQINEGIKESAYMIIGKGVLINLLNPKLTLFFFSFLPQFIDNSANSYLYQMTVLSIFFMVVTFIVFILYGFLANYFKNFIVSSPNVMRRIQQSFGIIFIGLAAKLALSDN
ncbi:MAG: LysE family translocator [Clostridiales bacterium]|nr:LysE family translocator [Clostridiales bacterium]